jgi:hypothetical protein
VREHLLIVALILVVSAFGTWLAITISELPQGPS